MTSAKFPLQIILGATDGVSGILGKVEGRLGKFGAKATAVGRKLTVGLSLPLLALGAGALMASANFQQGMNNVAAITRSTGTPALAAMSAQAKELGATTIFSATQAADAMGILAQAGQDSATILGTLPTVLELAAAGNLELGQAADIATSILAGQQEGVEMLGKRTDQLVRISQSAKTDIGQLGEALNIAGALSKGAGQSFETTVAVLGKFADANKRGSEGGLVLRRSLSRLLKPAAEAKVALGDLKLGKKDILNDDGTVRDFISILGELEKRGATAGQVMTIFGEIAGPTLIATLGMGTKALGELRSSVDDTAAAGARAEFAAVRMAGAMGGIAGFRSAIEALGIAIGESGLLEWFTAAIKGTTLWLRGIAATNPKLLKWGTIVAVAAAAAGPLLIAIGMIATGYAAVSSALAVVLPILGTAATLISGTLVPAIWAWTTALLANPVFLIVAGVELLIVGIVALVKNWDAAVAGMKRGFSALLNAAKGALNWIDDKLGFLANFVMPPWLRWIINRFSGGKDADLNINVNDASAAGAAAGAAPLTNFSSSTSTSRVRLDLNLPEGATATRTDSGDAPLDVSLGYNLAGAL